jgi:hypothetical protein
MSVQIILKKKRKKQKQDKILLMDYECLEDIDKAKLSIETIRKKLMQIMRYHIGRENSINPVQLFEQIYGVSPFKLDTFTRSYWWNIIKSVMRAMRRDGSLFVINRGRFLFVLKTQEESNAYKTKIDSDIQNLIQCKRNADEWVRLSKWKNL